MVCSFVGLSTTIATVEKPFSQDMIQAIAREIVKEKSLNNLVQSRSTAGNDNKIETVSQVLGREGIGSKVQPTEVKSSSNFWPAVDEKRSLTKRFLSAVEPIKEFFTNTPFLKLFKGVTSVTSARKAVTHAKPRFHELIQAISAIFSEFFEICTLFFLNFFEPLND